MRLALTLLSLSLVLTACPGPGELPENDPICPQAVPAGALTPASVRSVGVVQTPVPAPDWTAPRVPGQVLVLNTGGTLSTQALTVLSTVRTQRVTETLTQAATPAGEGDRAFAARLEAAGLDTQPDYLYTALATPNDPGYPGNRGVTIEGGPRFQTYLTRIGAPGAWDFLAGCGKTPQAALTAVLDTGVDASHADLGGRLLAGRSFLTTPSSATSTDEQGHGTGVAGLIGASTNNGVGLSGVTWSGSLLPVKVLGPGGGSTSTVAAGLNYAVRQGARVINMSLGRTGVSGEETGDAALDAAINAAAQSAVVVVSAGNTPNEGVYYPANNPNVIAVGAVGARNDVLACYSARRGADIGRDLDLVAPGGAGRGTCAGATADQDLPVLDLGGGYALSAGTSEAAPLVSGVAALMRAANPGLTAAQTRALLVGSANRSGGLPLLDAEAAVRAATR